MKSPYDSQLLVKGTHIPQQECKSVATSTEVSESVLTNRAKGRGEGWGGDTLSE